MQGTNPFKVGDNVICVDDDNGDVTSVAVGNEYTVTGVRGSFIDIYPNGGLPGGWNWWRFELNQTPEPDPLVFLADLEGFSAGLVLHEAAP